jgi:signal transduction histidine kinase
VAESPSMRNSAGGDIISHMSTRRHIKASTAAFGLAVLGMLIALAVGDHYTRAAGSTVLRVAVWGGVLLAMIALVLVLRYERHQARSVEERSQELEQLSAELYRANRAKAEFLASVSHELRTPLSAIVGFIDLLRDGAYGELTPRQRGPVERIESSANHLRDLVEQVLDLARMAAGRVEVHPESVRLRPFVIDVVAEMEPLAAARTLAFSIQVPATLPRVVTDLSHLRRILVNLVGNAIKFTPSGGITVRAQAMSEADVAAALIRAGRRPLLVAHGSWIALHVADTGIGIAAVDQDRIFEEFEQVNPGTRAESERRGTGLGLAISRRLARLLDGDITVESAPGKGSVFTVWLPADGAPPAG